MATTHQSGFSGTLTFGTGPSSLVQSPGTLRRWSVAQSTGIIQGYAKGDVWKTKFPTVNRWSADVDCLVSDGVTPATQLLTAQVIVTVSFFTNASDKLVGNGTIISMTFDDPLDGPVVAKMKILGNGILTPTAA